MKAKHRTKRIQRYRKMLGIIVLMLTITLIGVVVSATVLYKRKNACKTPDTTLSLLSFLLSLYFFIYTTNVTSTSPLLQSTFSVFLPISLCFGKLLSPFLTFD